jgi:uncharacterized protein
MEDLLASIRKAIDNDVGEGASHIGEESRGTLMRGALRELRVNLNETRKNNRATAEEIAELRGRILRNATDVPPIPHPPRRAARPAIEPPPPRQKLQPPQTRNEFKGIMAGPRSERPERMERRERLIDQRVLPPPQVPDIPPPPVLRAQTLQDEFDELTYQDGAGQEDYGLPQEEGFPSDAYVAPAASYAQPQAHYQPQAPRMLSNSAEAATQAAFRHLSDSLFAHGMGGRSLEDVTRELLRGMLKQWLDDNLPPLVERLVREEISRVARNGR